MRTMLFCLALTVISPVTVVHAADDEHSDHVSEMEGLRAVHAWTQATNHDHALIFVDIENTGEHAITLLGGSCDIATEFGLVGFQMKDGEGTYVPVPMVPIAPGTELVLAPEALALHIDGLNRKLVEGEEFEAVLEFDTGHLEVHVAVEPESATHHSHVGHNH